MKRTRNILHVLSVLIGVLFFYSTSSAGTTIVIDNTDSECTYGELWSSSQWDDGYYGSNYAHDGSESASATNWVKWTPDIVKEGIYQIYLRWTQSNNRPDAAPISIKHGGGVDDSKRINQQINGGQWQLIGEYPLAGNMNHYVKLLCTDEGYTVADAVKFVLLEEVPDIIIDNSDSGYTETGKWQESGLQGYKDTSTRYSSQVGSTGKWSSYVPQTGNYSVFVWFPAHENSSSNASYTITSLDGTWTKAIDQKVGGDAWVKLATISATEDTAVAVGLKVKSANTRADAIMFRSTTEEPDPVSTPDGGDGDGRILLNQSGFDLYKPKRFTIYGMEENTVFQVKKGETVVYTGSLSNGIGDFSDFNPLEDGEYYIECNGKTSVDFAIKPYWMQRVSIYPALDFMIKSRSDAFEWGKKGIGWRDSHQFSFELNGLALQYMANPSAYDRMAYSVNASESEYSELQQQDEPDLIWLLQFGVKRYLDINENDHKALHELIKGQIPYFLYLYPAIDSWVDYDFYERVRDMAISEWSTSNNGDNWYDVGGHDSNLFETKTVYGGGKGSYPPGHSIIPNLMMYEVVKRDGLSGQQAYFDAAYNNCQWVINHVEWQDPSTTKGQRMSEHITMEALSYFLEVYPDDAPPGLEDKINQWVDIMISRSQNQWDFRKYDDPADGVGTDDIWIIPSFNEPGNIAGSMAAIYAARRVAGTAVEKERLEEMAIAQIDNMFGRNPYGRHYSYDAPNEIEGVEQGWFSEYSGGNGMLNNVIGVLDGSPKEAAYPYDQEAAEGYTEGWVAFNSAWNASLAYSAAEDTDLMIFNEDFTETITSITTGSTIGIRLKAPLNFNESLVEQGQVIIKTSKGEEINIQVVEENNNSLYFKGYVILEDDDIEWIKISYGYGHFKEEKLLIIN